MATTTVVENLTAAPLRRFKSLREYLKALEQIGELQEIDTEVDWNLEIGAISKRAGEIGAAAPLFNNIKGVEKGMRVLGAPGGISHRPGQYLARIALAIGLPHQTTGREIVEALAAARGRSPIPPKLIATGPCKENVFTGDSVDLLRLPTPLLHDGDGGRYLNTFGIICAQTPDKKWTNWSIARIMLVDKNRMAGIVAPNQHIGMVRKTWSDLGKPMPFALALGAEPFLPYVGGMPIPEYVDEAGFAGALFGEPIEVVQCETVDLQVPATSEIVIEGHLYLETELEGPMGEYAGYLWSGPPTQKPLYRASALTYRNNPILPISVAGEPVEENHTAWGVPNAAEIVFVLRQAGFPVASAWTPFESANHLYVISLERDWRKRKPSVGSSQMCRHIGDVLFNSKAGMGTPKYMVVNDDIDITDVKQVMWALMTRNHPGSSGQEVFNAESTNPLVAFLDEAEKMSMHTTKVIYNCLPPDHWGDKLPKRSSFRGTYPAELQEKVLANWTSYGFKS